MLSLLLLYNHPKARLKWIFFLLIYGGSILSIWHDSSIIYFSGSSITTAVGCSIFKFFVLVNGNLSEISMNSIRILMNCWKKLETPSDYAYISYKHTSTHIKLCIHTLYHRHCFCLLSFISFLSLSLSLAFSLFRSSFFSLKRFTVFLS